MAKRTQRDKLTTAVQNIVQGWVFGDGAVVYAYVDDERGERQPTAAYPVGYSKWMPGVWKWYELGGTEGRHVHSTTAHSVEATHALGIKLLDERGRTTAYITPVHEAYDGDELARIRAQLVQRDEAMASPKALDEFLNFFDNE